MKRSRPTGRLYQAVSVSLPPWLQDLALTIAEYADYILPKGVRVAVLCIERPARLLSRPIGLQLHIGRRQLYVLDAYRLWVISSSQPDRVCHCWHIPQSLPKSLSSETSHHCRCLVLDERGDRVYLWNYAVQRLLVLDAVTGQTLGHFEIGLRALTRKRSDGALVNIVSMALDEDRRLLYVAASNGPKSGMVLVLHADTGLTVSVLRLAFLKSHEICALALDGEREHLIVCTFNEQPSLHMLRLSDGRVMQTFLVPSVYSQPRQMLVVGANVLMSFTDSAFIWTWHIPENNTGTSAVLDRESKCIKTRDNGYLFAREPNNGTVYCACQTGTIDVFV